MSKRKKNDVLTGGKKPDGSMAEGWAGARGDVMRDEFGLEIPVENVPLPSRGVIYPPEHPLHLVETVQIRAMTAREEDILTSKALIKKGTVITELIKSCLIDKSVNPNDMILGDRNDPGNRLLRGCQTYKNPEHLCHAAKYLERNLRI